MAQNAIKLKVSGMTCGNCAKHVTEELKEVSGIDRVSVLLNSGGVSTVDMFISKDISDAAIQEAVAEAGDYAIEEITRYSN
ncbi:heavy-metal-associated domain-containing protein [Arcanobacterium hippocoleae]|uniref:Copper chaperone CopZ n=1 Tax=Arcanobacterium hippocoleae TaxID=149017 RepID=A0ABU1T2A6_9ACTO|nr:heavy-metal-associated domain-containing protein [Arcanobacterium hippocoleae]MDR6939503.1 copper chaperone CopZ [Arcanobacterium hippocoleae]